MHMCYGMDMATTPRSSPDENRATSRTVVLLRATDRKKLKRLAARENVSAGEIIRRSLDSYQSLEARIRKEEEDKMIGAALRLLNDSLAGANESMAGTIAKLDELHEELAGLDRR